MICISILISSLFLFAISAMENCTVPYQPNSTHKFPTLVPYSFNETFQVIEIDNLTSGAMCLDGSNYKFWFKRGNGSGINKWMFNWQGAGFCGTDGINILDSCLDRSTGIFGSSSSYGENGSTTTSTEVWGFFSSIQDFNPVFYNWNKIFIISCDGANHQGSLKDPIVYNGTNLWFRGFNNTMGAIEYIRTHYNLFEAEEIMLSGGSSGGLASYAWMSYLQHYFPDTTKLFGLPDAGFFVDTYDEQAYCHLFRYMIQQMAQLVDSKNCPLYQYCKYFGMDEIWKCLIPEYFYGDIRFPVFISNSQIDYVQLTNLNGIECIMIGTPTSCHSKDKRKITKIREYFLDKIFQIKLDKPQWGFFLRTCIEHTYSTTWAWYGGSMNSFNAEEGKEGGLRQALYEWYNDGMIKEHSLTSYIDLLDWLHNPKCRY